MKKFNTLIYIGRFQPFHNGHLHVVKEAAKLCDNLLIMIGSSDEPRTVKNPFTYAEREAFIKASTFDVQGCKIYFEPLLDYPYDDAMWVASVRGTHSVYRTLGGADGIIGHTKDASSAYLEWFPSLTHEEISLYEEINATDIRNDYFFDRISIEHLPLPEPVKHFLDEFKDTTDYSMLVDEAEYYERYQEQFEHLPYAPVFITVDVLVVVGMEVLLIRRAGYPGDGLLALPGGFLDANDVSLTSAAVRELWEETGIRATVAQLSPIGVFDAKQRSLRGRVVTHAFVLTLDDKPGVVGNSESTDLRWVNVDDVERDQCFEDHYHIIHSPNVPY